jgi:hypothetical protein
VIADDQQPKPGAGDHSPCKGDAEPWARVAPPEGSGCRGRRSTRGTDLDALVLKR